MKKLQPVRGTRDVLEEEFKDFQAHLMIWNALTMHYGFNMVDTPILEDSEVFKKTLGVTSDIIKKETYTFKDRSNNEITLRPEGTAPIIRFFINNKLQKSLPQKFSYVGPMFRYDRPQKGRFRQFNQFGVEVIGEKDIAADIELIYFARDFVNKVGISDKSFKIYVNSLGDEVSRKKYTLEIQNFFQDHKRKLTSESLERLKKNPLRILDTKNNEEKKLLIKAPKLKDFLNTESSDIFEEFKEGCRQLKIPITINDNLVRGLDYYSGTVFEVFDKNSTLGALAGGGRYDTLTKAFKREDIGAAGVAGGVERIILTMQEQNIIPQVTQNRIAVLYINDEMKKVAHSITSLLRLNNIPADIDLVNRNLKKQMDNASNARFSIIVGPQELENGNVVLRDMKDGKEGTISLEKLTEDPKSIFNLETL